ncbi:MAG: divergent polysaccharide deacetylase family protein, partial [Candidatus Eiseniibacteriota bacterium]
ARVLEGSERWTDDGALAVRLLIGLPRRATHEVLLVRGLAPADPAGAPARVALVLYGFGEDAAEADSFFALSAPFAVAVVPGGKSGERVLDCAHERQREVVLHLPLEPINYPRVNPGPGTLLVSMSPRHIGSTVRRQLGRAGAVTAVANHMGSLATQDMTMMTALYRELKRRRVAFLHVTPAPGAVCKTLAAEMGVNYDEPDEVVDREAREDNAKALDRRWSDLLEEARARGRLVVMMRATPLTKRWLPRALSSRRLGGVDIVPLAALLEKPGAL